MARLPRLCPPPGSPSISFNATTTGISVLPASGISLHMRPDLRNIIGRVGLAAKDVSNPIFINKLDISPGLDSLILKSTNIVKISSILGYTCYTNIY